MLRLSLIVSILLLGGVGCAGIPLSVDQCNAATYATAHEAELCLKAAADYVTEQYDREDRRIKRFDKLIAKLNACDRLAQYSVVEIRRIGRSKLPNSREMTKARRTHGYPYTHDNVNPRIMSLDVQCWPNDELRRVLDPTY